MPHAHANGFPSPCTDCTKNCFSLEREGQPLALPRLVGEELQHPTIAISSSVHPMLSLTGTLEVQLEKKRGATNPVQNYILNPN